jgi:ubiquinone biosynthesis protein UbiJ
MDWDSNATWKRQIERTLNRLGSMVTGNQKFQADRIADVIEQIDELRQELKRVADRQDKIAEFIRANIPKSCGESGE